MAVGTVSALEPNQWQLITSVTPSGTSVTFNNFSGYKTLMIVGKGVTKSDSGYPAVQVNGNGSSGNYATLWNNGTQTKFLCQGPTSNAQGFVFRIYDCDKAIPHKVDTSFDGTGNHGQSTDAFVDPVVVTSLVLTTLSGSTTYTGGTVYVYGIAA